METTCLTLASFLLSLFFSYWSVFIITSTGMISPTLMYVSQPQNIILSGYLGGCWMCAVLNFSPALRHTNYNLSLEKKWLSSGKIAHPVLYSRVPMFLYLEIPLFVHGHCEKLLLTDFREILLTKSFWTLITRELFPSCCNSHVRSTAEHPWIHFTFSD